MTCMLKTLPIGYGSYAMLGTTVASVFGEEWGWAASRGVDDPDYPRVVIADGVSFKVPTDEIARYIVELHNRTLREE